MHTAEKIETIVDCFLRSGATSGTMGQLVTIEGGYRVIADGLTVIVRSTAMGWSVSFKGYQGIDCELYVAAHNALEAGMGRDVSTAEEALA